MRGRSSSTPGATAVLPSRSSSGSPAWRVGRSSNEGEGCTAIWVTTLGRNVGNGLSVRDSFIASAHLCRDVCGSSGHCLGNQRDGPGEGVSYCGGDKSSLQLVV